MFALGASVVGTVVECSCVTVFESVTLFESVAFESPFEEDTVAVGNGVLETENHKTLKCIF